MESRVNEKPSVGGDETFYTGVRPGQVTIRAGSNRRPLAPRFDLHKYPSASFTAAREFAWGAAGEGGPAQLSLALLADALGDDARALQLHHRFNRRVITMLPPRWTMTRSRVVAYADLMERREAAGFDDA